MEYNYLISLLNPVMDENIPITIEIADKKLMILTFIRYWSNFSVGRCNRFLLKSIVNSKLLISCWEFKKYGTENIIIK